MLIEAFLTNEGEFESKLFLFIQSAAVAVVTMFGNKTLL